jgi:hypothetical protein
MNRNIERSYPYAAAVAAAAGYYYGGFSFPKGQDVLSASITIGAIFTGFLATSKSLAISIDTPAMNELRKTRFFDLMVQYLREAIYASLLLGAFGIAGFFHDPQSPPRWYGVVWILLIISTFLTFARVTNAFLVIIQFRKNG